MTDNENRNRRRRLVAIGITTAAVLAISAGAMSLALFTDDEDVDNNTFNTGTIELTATPASALFTVAAMMPGDTVYGQLTVANAGSAELRYALTSNSTNTDGKALRDAVQLTVREKASGTCSDDFTGTVVSTSALADAAFGDPAAGNDAGDRTLGASDSEDLCFRASLPLATGNAYQGAATTTTFTFQAEQTANNP